MLQLELQVSNLLLERLLPRMHLELERALLLAELRGSLAVDELSCRDLVLELV